MKLIDEISVFFPAYNEEKNIEKTVLIAHRILKRLAQKFEIVIIDDGSVDATLKIIKRISSKYANIRVVTHNQNKGYGASLISGFYHSKYNLIAFTDSDGQFDFSEIEKFIDIQRQKNADLIIGYYLDRQVSFVRKMNSLLWQFLIRILFNLKVKDIDCGFKLLKKNVISTIPKLESQRGAFISTELLIKAKACGFKIVEIPVHHYARKKGSATGANLNVILSSFKDLFLMRSDFNT